MGSRLFYLPSKTHDFHKQLHFSFKFKLKFHQVQKLQPRAIMLQKFKNYLEKADFLNPRHLLPLSVMKLSL